MIAIDIDKLETIARDAGAEIKRIYDANSYQVTTKADFSPVTEADLAANAIITLGLKDFGDIPYISEEETAKIRKPSPDRYWLIDPLDGTKEFVNRRRAFTVNIALIENGSPTVAVVYDPITDEMFSAHNGRYRENGLEIPREKPWPQGTVLLSSHSHPEAPLASFIERNSITEHHRLGSSLKFCQVARRAAHIYPRFRALNAWDTAAGDGVARAAGCRVIDWQTGLPPVYAYDQPFTAAFYVAAPNTAIQR